MESVHIVVHAGFQISLGPIGPAGLYTRLTMVVQDGTYRVGLLWTSHNCVLGESNNTDIAQVFAKCSVGSRILLTMVRGVRLC